MVVLIVNIIVWMFEQLEVTSFLYVALMVHISSDKIAEFSYWDSECDETFRLTSRTS